jgi:trehalose 6-phosphate synthase
VAQNSRWDARRLRAWLASVLGGEPVVVLANRQPFRHDFLSDGSVAVGRSSGGLVTALEPLIEACSGVWVAHGAGTADRTVVDRWDGVMVPPANPRYRLRRVWLSPDEERHYYYGFANEGLWPFCHRAGVAPVFRAHDFECYRLVNERFADAVSEEVTSDHPLVLVQDYHFALAPASIRARLPSATIVSFWHIPWPSRAETSTCPWIADIVRGLLGSSIAGFQTDEDAFHFLDAAASTLHARVDRRRRTVTYRSAETAVRTYPVSVAWPSASPTATTEVECSRSSLCRRLNLPDDAQLVVGIDRFDYTKGLNEKCLAVERLLEDRQDLVGRVFFVQVAEPSRDGLPAYQALRAQVSATADRINRRFSSSAPGPIVLLPTRHEPMDVIRLLRAADVCYVGSLHDGMNLVAKEFVAARNDLRGVLVLSRYAGAARELYEALIVDPRRVSECARVLARALDMPPAEQSRRMRRLRAVVGTHNAHAWAARMLSDAALWRAPVREPSHAGLQAAHAATLSPDAC